MDREKIIAAVGDILEAIGENPQREGLLRTPERVADMYAEILDGIAKDPKEYLVTQFTEDKHEEMVIFLFHRFASII